MIGRNVPQEPPNTLSKNGAPLPAMVLLPFLMRRFGWPCGWDLVYHYFPFCRHLDIIGVLLGGETVKGWASTVVLLSFLSGVQLMTIGLIGLYVGRIYSEVKGRPLYFVDPDPAVNTDTGEQQQRPDRQ